MNQLLFQPKTIPQQIINKAPIMKLSTVAILWIGLCFTSLAFLQSSLNGQGPIARAVEAVEAVEAVAPTDHIEMDEPSSAEEEFSSLDMLPTDLEMPNGEDLDIDLELIDDEEMMIEFEDFSVEEELDIELPSEELDILGLELPSEEELLLELEMPGEDEVFMEFPGQEERVASMDRQEETISVDFPDEEIRTIVSNVADLYDLNVVIPDTLVGSMSLKLRNVTWRQVLEVVLEPVGYTFIEDRNIIKIKSRDDLLLEPVETTVIVVKFANAGDLMNAISPMVDGAAGGRVQVDARRNALIITERPSRMNALRKVIDDLDRRTEQVMIESKFIEVTNRDLKNLGVNWSSLSSFNLSAGPFKRAFDRTSGQNTSNSDGDSLLQDTILSSTSTLTDTDGISSFTDTLSNTTNLANSISELSNFANSTSQGRLDSAVFDADAFRVVLSALTTLSDSELISNPTVVTLNNQLAKIVIGEKFPIPNYTYNEERGTFEVAGFTYEDIGIVLEVTPHVSGGFINLDIKPRVSSRAGTVSFGGAAGAEIPIIATRETESKVSIRDGYTLAIGGLIEKQSTVATSKVPLLGSIPGIGRLFRHKSKDTQKRNLIIFITAKILDPAGSTYKDVISPKLLHEIGISERDIPGYQFTDEEMRLYDDISARRSELNLIDEKRKLYQQLGALDRMRNRGKYSEDPSTAMKKKIFKWK